MFRGSMVALVTPMGDDGSLDLPAFDRLVEFHVEQGTCALVVAGNWRTIARLEELLGPTGTELGLDITRHAATEAVEATEGALPYAVDLLSLDQPGIVFRLVRFLTQRKVRITELSTMTYVAQQTGAPMVSLHMSLAIPASTHIATLREDFMILCDELNLDAVLEPIKG